MTSWLNADHKRLPVDELDAVRNSIRRVARTLWTLSLAVGRSALSPWLSGPAPFKPTTCTLPTIGGRAGQQLHVLKFIAALRSS